VAVLDADLDGAEMAALVGGLDVWTDTSSRHLLGIVTLLEGSAGIPTAFDDLLDALCSRRSISGWLPCNSLSDFPGRQGGAGCRRGWPRSCRCYAIYPLALALPSACRALNFWI
jgi:hypothetical protein